MTMVELPIPGTLLIVPEPLTDERGSFYEGVRVAELEERLGHPFPIRQVNYSVSRRNTVRGIHAVRTPPGQEKLVTCTRGMLRDFVVDLRVGSPTFGQHASTVLDARSGHSVYVPDGVGHGFLAMTDDTTICYLLSTAYVPGTQIDVNPLDLTLDLPWGFTGTPLLSDKDAKAPGLLETLRSGVLPPWVSS